MYLHLGAFHYVRYFANTMCVSVFNEIFCRRNLNDLSSFSLQRSKHTAVLSGDYYINQPPNFQSVLSVFCQVHST